MLLAGKKFVAKNFSMRSKVCAVGPSDLENNYLGLGLDMKGRMIWREVGFVVCFERVGEVG